MTSDEKEPKGADSAGPAEAEGAPAERPDKLAADLEKARAQLAGEKAKAEEYLDLARRAKADFINYQDRVRRERQEWSRQALENFVREFLPALDAFTMARFEDPKLVEALKVIEKEFLRVLGKARVVPLDTAGKTFDPLYHEAVSVEERDDLPEGTILEEVRRGWTIEGRLIRPAAVRISKRPPSPNGQPPPAGGPPDPGRPGA
jgi:molecular chaperone GrpE